MTVGWAVKTHLTALKQISRNLDDRVGGNVHIKRELLTMGLPALASAPAVQFPFLLNSPHTDYYPNREMYCRWGL